MAKTATTAQSSVLNDLQALQGRVVERIRELEPYMEELATLREQAERMGIDLSEQKPARRVAATKPAARKSTGSRGKRSGAKPRRRRRAGNGESRSDQVLKLVREQPGIAIPELGNALGVDSTGLYRVARNLEAEGLIRKEGRQLQPVTQSDAVGEPDDAAPEEVSAS